MSGRNKQLFGRELVTKKFRMMILKIVIDKDRDCLVEYLGKYLNRNDREIIYAQGTSRKRCGILLDKLSAHLAFSDDVFWDLTRAIGDYELKNLPHLQRQMEEEYRNRATPNNVLPNDFPMNQPVPQQAQQESCGPTTFCDSNFQPQTSGMATTPALSKTFDSEVLCISKNQMYVIFVCRDTLYRLDLKSETYHDCRRNLGNVKNLLWFYRNTFFILYDEFHKSHRLDILKAPSQCDSEDRLISDEWRSYIDFDFYNGWISVLVQDKNIIFVGNSHGKLLTFGVLDDSKCRLMSEAELPITGLSGMAVSPQRNDVVHCVAWSIDTFAIGEVVYAFVPYQVHVEQDRYIAACNFMKHDLLVVCYSCPSWSFVALELWCFSQDQQKFCRKCEEKQILNFQISLHFDMYFDEEHNVLVLATDCQYLLLKYNQQLDEYKRENISENEVLNLYELKLVRAYNGNAVHLIRCYDKKASVLTIFDQVFERCK